MRLAPLVLLVTLGCGRGAARRPQVSQPTRAVATTVGDRILPLLPEGAQVIIELDLARLRANPVVGKLVTDALLGPALPIGLTAEVPMSPLAQVDTLVLASYGLGTSNAATVTILATREPVPNSVSLGPGLVALGPQEWTAQLEARAALAGLGADAKAPAIVASRELLLLREHAMPAGAPGAALRITARLSFDARVALARQTGLDAPPARISIWADVVDDLAIIIDADAVDPGDKKSKHPTKRLEAGLRAVLGGVAGEPAIQALGLPSSLSGARIVAKGTWVRAIIAVGPAHLQRVVQRASAMLSGQGPPRS
ncbi:MAG: hypothetical protein IPQ07_21035 [Myxococcales bacterium]|nr:hypothetical protein [Myxococcales bacterium]